MYSSKNEATRWALPAVLCVAAVAATTFSAGAESTPTPTPRPGTLAAYASRTAINRTSVDAVTGQVTVTTENLEELAKGGTIIFGSPLVGESATRETPAGPTERERELWRKRHQKQRAVIAKLEARRSKVEVEIDHIKDGKLTIRNLARLDRAEAKLSLIEGEIRREQAALAKIIREARQHGAQPGWFR